MNKLMLPIVIVAFAVAGWFFITNSNDDATAQSGNESKQLPNIQLKDYDNNTVALSNFSGKSAVMNVWASWCPFCRQELPDFVALQKEFPDIAVIAINRAEPPSVSRPYLQELGVENDMTFLIDPDDDFYRAIGGYAMPQTVFVAKDGTIVFHKRGPMTLEEMRSAVKEHLQ